MDAYVRVLTFYIHSGKLLTHKGSSGKYLYSMVTMSTNAPFNLEICAVSLATPALMVNSEVFLRNGSRATQCSQSTLEANSYTYRLWLATNHCRDEA